jgi:hypothetical protein
MLGESAEVDSLGVIEGLSPVSIVLSFESATFETVLVLGLGKPVEKNERYVDLISLRFSRNEGFSFGI